MVITVDVETLPGRSFGQTIIDLHSGAENSNCNFAFKADRDLFCKMLQDLLGKNIYLFRYFLKTKQAGNSRLFRLEQVFWNY